MMNTTPGGLGLELETYRTKLAKSESARKKAVSALVFYASKESWEINCDLHGGTMPSLAEIDSGIIARNVLTGIG